MKCALEHARKIQNADNSGRDLLYFLDAGSAAYLREKFGYGRATIVRFLNETYDGLLGDMDWYSADDDNDRDKMGNAYYGMINRLKCEKIYPREWEEQLLKSHTYITRYYRGHGRLTGDIRKDFAEHAWLVAVTYFARVVEWLHVDRHFGPTRCERVYRDLRAMYDEYIDHYLECSRDGDLHIRQMREDARKVLESIEVEIEHNYGG